MEKFIVAEITKNWTKETPAENLISQRFEEVINANAARGYKLNDFRLSTIKIDDVYTETIIAVFEKAETGKIGC